MKTIPNFDDPADEWPSGPPPELVEVTKLRPPKYVVICMECPEWMTTCTFMTADAMFAYAGLHRYAHDGHNPMVFL